MPNSSRPSIAPATVPRPPEIETPPTTAAAITFSSSPIPALLGIWWNRTALNIAANPVSAPVIVNAANTTSDGLMPASRAAFGSLPVAYTMRPAARLRRPQCIAAVRSTAHPIVMISLTVCDWPNHRKLGGRSCIHAPCVTQRNPSRSATMVASVTTIDGIRTHATSAPFTAPITAPTRHAHAPATGVGIPMRANTPAATLQIANCDPTEISICAVRITSNMPSATISTGMLASTKSRRFSNAKNPGAAAASTTASARITAMSEISRR